MIAEEIAEIATPDIANEDQRRIVKGLVDMIRGHARTAARLQKLFLLNNRVLVIENENGEFVELTEEQKTRRVMGYPPERKDVINVIREYTIRDGGWVEVQR